MDILRNIDVDSLLNSDVSNSSPQLWLENDTTPNLSAEIIAKLPRSRLRLKEKSRLLPERAVVIMNEWYKRNYQNPYPTYREIELMAQRGSISIAQVKQWFVNIRRRTGNQFRKKRDTRVVEASANDESTDVDNQSINTTTFSPNVSSYDVNQSTSTPTSRPIYYPNSYPYYYNNYPYSPTVASPSSYYPNSSPAVNSFYPYYNNFASYYSPTSNSFSSQSSLSDSNPSTSVNDSNQSMANNSTSTFYPPYFNY